MFVIDDFLLSKLFLNCRYFLSTPLLLSWQFINRPYVIKGPELQSFLQALRDIWGILWNFLFLCHFFLSNLLLLLAVRGKHINETGCKSSKFYVENESCKPY